MKQATLAEVQARLGSELVELGDERGAPVAAGNASTLAAPMAAFRTTEPGGTASVVVTVPIEIRVRIGAKTR